MLKFSFAYRKKMRKQCESFVAATINCEKNFLSYFFAKFSHFIFPKTFAFVIARNFSIFACETNEMRKVAKFSFWNQVSLSKDQIHLKPG